MELSIEQIEKINEECPYNQGVFLQPFGIPNGIQERVIYTRWDSEWRDGSCWYDENTENPVHYQERPQNAYKVLDLVLKELKPEITYLQYKTIEGLFDSNKESDYGYYGDYTIETIEWIKLSDLYEALKTFEK